MTYDEILKNILLQKSKDGFAVVSVYDGDFTKKNRRNTKRAGILEELVLESGFQFKKISFQNERKETEIYFVIFGQDINSVVEKWAENPSFRVFNISYDLENLLKDIKFNHPMTKAAKEACRKRHEIFYEDAVEVPEQAGKWHLYRILGENSFMYSKENSNLLCAIRKQPDGTWIKHYGTIQPCGTNMKKVTAGSLQEALRLL